jgi:hypothetical protein
MNNAEGMLTRVVEAIERTDFFRAVLLRDTFHDWSLAKDFGNFLVRIEPDEIMGHAILARAHRHLGDSKLALIELEHCRVGVPHPSERELFQSFLAEEEKLLSSGTTPPQQ